MRRKLAETLEAAHVDIECGRVIVAGAPTTNPARLVAPADPIVVQQQGERFVSRAGYKLDAALERFAVDVRDKRALDVGASTGGFTDCLLRRGARQVVAVDVGYGLLHEKLLNDRRVESLERTNIRRLDEAIVGSFDLVVADLSFISLHKVLDTLVDLCRPEGLLMMLVKPQFEARRTEADRGRGVITEPNIWRRVLEDLITAVRRRGAVIMGVMASPITGAEGNIEFLVLAHPADEAHRSESGPPVDLDALVAEVSGRRER